MKSAIITGGTGALGTALINELVNNNIKVLVLCRKNSSREDNIISHYLVTKDFCNLDELADYEVNNKYDVFYHLGWDGTSGISRDDFYLQNENVKFSLDAVALAKRAGCSLFIGVGSQAEYGRVSNILKSNTPTFPVSGYGIGKLSAYYMTYFYAKKLELRHIWVRVLSVFGINDNPNSMIISLVGMLVNNKKPEMTKCEQVWDYLYSKDAGRAFRLIGEKGVSGKVYVLGSGKSRILKEYVESVRDVLFYEGLCPKTEICFGKKPYYSDQSMYLMADISDLKYDTGWEPRFSFEEGIRDLCSDLGYKTIRS